MTGSLGRPDKGVRKVPPGNLEFDAQAGSNPMTRLIAISHQGAIIDKGRDTAR